MLLKLLVLTTFLQLVSARAPAGYTDDFARRKMWPMCRMSGTNSTSCLNACFNKWEFAGETVVICDLWSNSSDTCAGSTIVSHDDQAIIVTFRGSLGSNQVNEQLGSLGNKTAFPGGGNVAFYYYNAFLKLWNGGMKNAFLTFKNKYPGYEVWVTGHSLGGILSSIGAAYISQLALTTPSNIKLINFAGPHGGDLAWAQRMPSLVPWAYRVVHHWDYVPHLPVNPDWQYTHHKVEIWYNNSMALGDPYITCVELESPSCSDSVPEKDWTWNDHGTYFEGKGCDLCQKNPVFYSDI